MQRVVYGVLGLLACTQVAADPSEGPDLFKPCAACHAVGAGAANMFGPQLNGVMERGAGGLGDYAYSDAMNASVGKGLDWSAAELDRYLEAPMEVMPGTKMAYPGLKDAAERASLIEWLAMIGTDGLLPVFEVEEPVKEEKETAPAIAARDVPIPKHGVLHLGREALSEEVAAWDIDIRPDGTGLPVGEGDALTGGELYDSQCAACHGVFGEGEGRWPVLAGGQDTLAEDRPEKTIGSYWPYLSTVYDYVRRAMPFGNARSLSDDDVYAITAYLLYLNDAVDEDFVLSSENFTDISMPNEGGFEPDDRFTTEPHYGVTEEPCMTDCKPEAVQVTMRARVLDVTPDNDSAAGEGAVD